MRYPTSIYLQRTRIFGRKQYGHWRYGSPKNSEQYESSERAETDRVSINQCSGAIFSGKRFVPFHYDFFIIEIQLTCHTPELVNLEEIKFPSQNHDLNDCLIHYSRLKLTHLNLGNFKETNDIGMQHISCMQQLRFLSLEGSQITDDGLTLLKGMCRLTMCRANRNHDDQPIGFFLFSLEMEHLEQLFLDRTAVTDDGITTISSKCQFTV